MRSTGPSLVLFAAAFAFDAEAASPVLRLESVDTRICAERSLVRVLFSELELDGQVRSYAAGEYRLVVDGVALGAPGLAPRSFDRADDPLAVAVVLQVNLAWQRDLSQLLAALEAFLGRLPPRTKTWLWTYGEEVTAVAAAVSPARCIERLGSIRPSDRARAAARTAIRQALDATQGLFGRTVVVVISDGLDDAPNRDEIRALGNLARARRAMIMPIAYSPTDDRDPFLNLAELARRSAGVFRWAESQDDVGHELEGLSDSLNQAWQMDFEMPDPCTRSHEVQIMHGELRSEPRMTLAEEPAGAPSWVWGLGGLVGLGATALLALLAIRARRA